uniref:interferon-induced helicase C domain-containing protein 1 n=1 Tax=Doryrhamphus excisus TaxID=161450 RepID=UPI0025AE8E06|nr:interferon-induced helicase C domain-containing protein 1 [Doryrhamphus excisus]
MNMDDVMKENLIDSFRPRLKVFISVEPVLDRLHIISADQREFLRQMAKTDGNSAAVDALISAVLRKPHPEGWFQAFVDALCNAGCQQAANYMMVKLPRPEVEEQNDHCMRMIDILVPSLLDMDTKVVCTLCFSRELITKDDMDIILCLADSQGLRVGARELLKRIVRCQLGWYSEFIQILRETEHQVLYALLEGSCDYDTTDLYRSESSLGDSTQSSPPDLKAASIEDETTGSKAVIDSPAESSASSQRLDDYKDMEAENDATDPSDPGGAPGSPDRAEIILRDYQKEVAQPALEGKNIIICLPTGSGKTRVAVYVTRQHLERRRADRKTGKVVVLVNKVPLVEQHHATEFQRFLKHAYKVERVSGNSLLKISFTEIMKKNDVVICTAQILQNYLERSVKGEDEGVHLKDISLIIIDECHHTKKGEVYNQVMMRYLKQKNKNNGLKKEQKETVPLPQILGLTASLGVGSATKLDAAEKNILQICANLDASQILTSNLGDYRNDPCKQIVLVEDKEKDPFGDVIKRIMSSIQTYAKLSPTCQLGSQTYEQWVVQYERQA